MRPTRPTGQAGRRPRSSQGDGVSLEQKLAELKRQSKDNDAARRKREEEFFMSPGQKKRAQIRRGRERAERDDRER